MQHVIENDVIFASHDMYVHVRAYTTRVPAPAVAQEEVKGDAKGVLTFKLMEKVL